MDLKNKTVIVTGSSSGIGQAVAIRFAKEGANVVVNYRLNKEGAEKTMHEIKKNSGKAISIQADITIDEDVKRLISTTIKKFSTIDILINNGAIGTDPTAFFDATSDDIKSLINVDLVGPMVVTKEVLKIMNKQKRGKIINTTSIRGWEYGGGKSIVYAASKAGLNSFTRTLAKHVAPNIQVNAVAPGYVKTRSYDGMSAEQIQGFLDQTLLKRWVTTDEVADAFIFLAQNDAMTGQVIYVDAGFTLK